VFDSGPSMVGTGTGAYTSTTADQRFKDIQGRWDELKQLDELRNPQRDRDSSRAGNSLFAEPPDSESIVFLHGLRFGGDDRLVVVWANWYGARLAGGLSNVFQSNESLSFWAVEGFVAVLGGPDGISGVCQVGQVAAAANRHPARAAALSEVRRPTRASDP
jgi:hypothetical protein